MIGRMFVGGLLLGGMCGVWAEFRGPRPHFKRGIEDVLGSFACGVLTALFLIVVIYAFGYVLGVV